MRQQLSAAAKKVFINAVLDSRVDEGGKIIYSGSIPIIRARLLGSLVSKVVEPGRRYIKITVDDGTGRLICNDYNVDHEPAYRLGQTYDFIVLLKYAPVSGIYGVVELLMPVPVEQTNLIRQLRVQEIAKLDNLLKRAIGGSGEE